MVASAVRMFTYILAFMLLLACKKRGQISSGPLFIFWLLEAVCGAITFRSVVRSESIANISSAPLPLVTYSIQYPLIVALFFLNFWADRPHQYKVLEEENGKPSPESAASFPSRMLFTWFDGMVWRGWRRYLVNEDLWTLNPSDRCRGVIPVWDANWDDQKKAKQPKRKPLSILNTLVSSFGGVFAASAILQLIYTIISFVSPQLVNFLIAFVESDEPMWRGYLYTITLIAVTMLNTIINSQYFFFQYSIGLKIRTALTSAIYRKSLRLSGASRKEMTVGETTNLMAIDTQKFMDVVLFLNMIWSSPLSIVLCMYFLWNILGVASLAGLAVMVLMIPMNMLVASKMKKYQIAQMRFKDKRVKLMDEVLNGIKVLKLYAWEPSFSYQILRIREEEIGSLKRAAYMNAFSTFLWTCAPFLVALCSFTVYVLIDPNNVLDAQTAFVSLTYFNMLRLPLNMLPNLIVYMVQCSVSLKRINGYMNSEELSSDTVGKDTNVPEPVKAQNASFTWDSTRDTLQDINMSVQAGSLVAVVGSVGSGKSSLLSALLGEMTRTSGSVNVHGTTAYVPQQAWIQNSTLEGNITFGKRYNRALYDRVVEACALRPDLDMLPAGDQTEIGERGINLSGGQKQRLSVARAVYSNRALYLLDDPLSAVDAHVGKHMFDKVFGPQGLLRHKTRVLVTHGVSYLPQVDNIIVMKEGRITESGSYRELLDRKGEFADFLIQYLSEKKETKEMDPETETELDELQKDLEQHLGKAQLQRKMSRAKTATAISDLDKDQLRRRHHGGSLMRTTSKSTIDDEEEAAHNLANTDAMGAAGIPVGQTLIDAEKAETGGVKAAVYIYYAKSVGFVATIVACLFYIGFQVVLVATKVAIFLTVCEHCCQFLVLLNTQGFQVGSNIWLSAWSGDPLASTDIGTRNKYLAVYGVLGLLQSLSIMGATLLCQVLISKGVPSAAYNLN